MTYEQIIAKLQPILDNIAWDRQTPAKERGKKVSDIAKFYLGKWKETEDEKYLWTYEYCMRFLPACY